MNKFKSSETVDMAYYICDGTDEMLPPLPPVVIVHGTFDCKENWKEIAENIADKLGRKVYVMDLRNHGTSPKLEDCSCLSVIDDIEKFLYRLNEPAVVIGHSGGGSAASSIALRKPDLIETLILIDISPVDYPLDCESKVFMAMKIMQRAVKALPKGLSLDEAKLAVDRYLELANMIKSFRKMVLSSLIKTESGIDWKINMKSVEEWICVRKTVRSSYPLQGSYNKNVLFVYGGLSDYIRPRDCDDIRKVMPNSTFKCIPECTHWIHMEKPDELTTHILHFLRH